MICREEYYYDCPKCGRVTHARPRLRKCRQCGGKLTATGHCRLVASDAIVEINGRQVPAEASPATFEQVLAPFRKALLEVE